MKSMEINADQGALVSHLRTRASLVVVHGKDLMGVGVETLQAVKSIVLDSGRQAARLLDTTRGELRRALGEGREQIRYRLAHLSTPTHKEQAEARKTEIKEKKRRKRAAEMQA